ncbi:DUF6397 family protein [Streptomyces alfalfae]|uniref:DUF6397 family protein n=1 Tax=Streptomyces alfalfae TaxID=1642299 RepID=UPI000F4D8CCF|nr:DUF6397 family protein [Streptomyces alfalfae]
MTDVMTTQPPTATAAPPSVALSGAAKELGLKRGEFDLAVSLGRIRVIGGPQGTQRRVTRAEIDRVRDSESYPGALHASLQLGLSQARSERPAPRPPGPPATALAAPVAVVDSASARAEPEHRRDDAIGVSEHESRGLMRKWLRRRQVQSE